MNGWRLEDPLWLLLLPPVLTLGLLPRLRRRRATVLYSSTQLVAAMRPTLALRFKRFLPWLRVLGLALLVVALARPQHGTEEFRARTEGIAIQMCLDRSGSMQAFDFFIGGERVNRLTAVKQVFRDFVAGAGELPGRPNDLIGLIAFGGYANSKCPLTLDHDVLLKTLASVKIPQPVRDARGRAINSRYLNEERATAIGDAVTLAADRLRQSEAKSKVVILLSDGENTAGVVDPARAAEAAKTLGVKIYTIGVGATGLAPFPTVDLFGRRRFTMQLVRLDEATLRMMAEKTGGRYFHAKNTEALHEVYAEINKLEKTVSEGKIYADYREFYQYAMFPALGLVLLEVLLVTTRFRSLP